MTFLTRFLDDAPPDDPLQRVKLHLSHLLFARRSFASFVHDYGLIRFSAESTGRNVAQVLLQEIQDNVLAHEPRLSAISLRTLEKDADQLLHIILKGRIANRACIFHLAFSMTLGWLKVIDAQWEDEHAAASK